MSLPLRILTLVLFTPLAHSSSAYIDSGLFQLALEDYYGSINVGVGRKRSSCFLCHSSAGGGAANINISFGQDFKDAAIRTVGTNGGNLPATGPLSLVTVISDSTFLAQDSDRDGDDNDTEFQADTDPADDIGETSSGGGGGGGSCGLVQQPPPTGKNTLIWLLLFLPILAITAPRLRSARRAFQS